MASLNPHSGGGATRGALLRSVTSLSTDIIANYARHKEATGRLEKETATKADLLARLAVADAELASLEAQKKFESENDTELSSLQVWGSGRGALDSCGRDGGSGELSTRMEALTRPLPSICCRTLGKKQLSMCNV